MTPLPIPSADALAHSQLLQQHIANTIKSAGGYLSFAQFMDMALYTPSLGYYSAGGQKFGDAVKGGGDFVTAPQMSPLFAHTIANQVAEVLVEIKSTKLNDFSHMNHVLQHIDSMAMTPAVTQALTHDVALNDLALGSILELGAGTGNLACDMLLRLHALNQLPAHYYILEVSDHLRQVQLETLQKHLPDTLLEKVIWLQALPQHFNGVIVANEVLDALAVHLVHQTADGLFERGVRLEGQDFVFSDVPFSTADATQSNIAEYATLLDLPTGYVTEFCPAAHGLVSSLANSLQTGAIILIDYGFSAREYYHPQRNAGTLMCHYQQLAHTNPLVYVGLQDITAHVDFTKTAQTGIDNGLELSGFCSQAQFLMNCGILDVLSEVSANDIVRYAPLASAAQKLLSPAEMGDLFKVIGFTKGLDIPLMGFSSGDKSHTL